MLATVHLADVGPGAALRTVLRPGLSDVAGLRWGQVALLAPLAMSGPPSVRRVGLLAFWDDEEAVDAFVDTHAVGRRLAGGFHARLRPLRAYGAWPGLPPEVPHTRAVPHEGPVVVLTLGRLRLSQAVRFLRASRPAERAAVEHDGMVWGTAGVRLPFVATVSVWRDTKAAVAYAYGQRHPEHSQAIGAQQRKDFHKQSAFIRFAPLRVEGALDGRNPLSSGEIAV